MSYAKKALDKIRDLPQDAGGVLLWVFPEEDFAVWKEMPDTPAMKSYGDYLAVVAAIQADVERNGKRVVRVRVPVATMIAELERHNWPNDNQHRAKVIGLLAAKHRQ